MLSRKRFRLMTIDVNTIAKQTQTTSKLQYLFMITCLGTEQLLKWDKLFEIKLKKIVYLKFDFHLLDTWPYFSHFNVSL